VLDFNSETNELNLNQINLKSPGENGPEELRLACTSL
jgi:hypothetical protein